MASWTDLNPGNPANPFDQIGQWHNDGLDHFIANYLSYNLSNPLSGESLYLITESIADYFNQNMMAYPNEGSKLELFEKAALGSLLPRKTNYNFPEFGELYSTPFNNYLTSLKTHVDNINVNDPQSFLTNVRNLEATIDTNTDMANNEKEIAYAMSSIARFSGAYWITEYNNYQSTGSTWANASSDIGINNFAANQPPDWVYSDLSAGISTLYVGAILAPLSGGTTLVGAAAAVAINSGGKAIFGDSWW